MFSRFKICSLLMPLVLAASAHSQTASPSPSCEKISLGTNGSLNGFVPSPDDAWHTDISKAEVDPNSNTFMVTNESDLAGYHLHPDFGSNFGIPYNVVDTSIDTAKYPQEPVPMLQYASDSDLTYYPVRAGLQVEDNPANCSAIGGDQHLIIIDRHSCTNYEMYQAQTCNGAWTAGNGLLFDLTDTEHRPYGLTSADASGLSVFEGLIRYDEILDGAIKHAIRFTTNWTQNNNSGGSFVAPATHAAGTLWGTDDVLGMRIRLKADFDISSYSETNKIILRAMKKYGLMLTDNGSKLFFQGTADPRWNDNDLVNLENVTSSDFEVIKLPTVYDSSSAPAGDLPVISNLTASPETVAAGGSVTITANVSGETYNYLSEPGVATGAIFRGSLTVMPEKTTVYTLTSRNIYGTTQATVTVTVPGSKTTAKK